MHNVDAGTSIIVLQHVPRSPDGGDKPAEELGPCVQVGSVPVLLRV